MRCYNGCPDSEYQSVLDAKAAAAKDAGKILKSIGARATYFPMEEKWMVFKGHVAMTEFCGTELGAANAALRNVNGAMRKEQ